MSKLFKTALSSFIYIVMILILVLVIWAVGNLINSVQVSHHIESEVSLNVGKNIVIDGDTLKVVDYSMWHSTYKLSNGSNVSWKLVYMKLLE